MSPVPPSSTASPLWTWVNPACGLFEFATAADLRAAVLTDRIAPDTPVWRDAPGCQTIPARFTTMPWTLHRGDGLPPVQLEFGSLQERHLAGALPPEAKLGREAEVSPEIIFGPVPTRG